MPLLRKMVRLLVKAVMEVPITGRCLRTDSVLQAPAVMFLTGCPESLLKTFWSKTLTGCPPPRPCLNPRSRIVLMMFRMSKTLLECRKKV